MIIAGLQKTTLLDYPGKVACTVFLAGCNFRCPFCQNWEIVTGKGEDITEEELFSFLKKRRGVLDGVCVTGGEPLINADIESFIGKIKDLGYSVKLDTNGSFPDKLKTLAEKKLVDTVAMDIKNCPSRYALTAGTQVDMNKIDESVKYLLSGQIDYELRTTVIDELHDDDSMRELAQWIKGAKRYYLQNFKDSDAVPYKNLSPCSEEKLNGFINVVKPFVPSAKIRGND